MKIKPCISPVVVGNIPLSLSEGLFYTPEKILRQKPGNKWEQNAQPIVYQLLGKGAAG